MGYVGTTPLSGDYRKLDDISGSFNGSTTDFTLQVGSANVTPPKETTMIISVGGILQEPITAYTVSGSTISFTSAPASGADFFGVLLGDTLAVGTPSDGTITAAKVENTFISGQTEITSGLDAADELLYSDGGTIKRVGLDTLADKLAGTNITASAGVLSGTADTNTTYTGGTNLTLAGTTFNVDDAFLVNNASDVTTGTITMAHLIIGDGGNIGSASDTNAIAISSGGDVTFSQDVLISDATYVKLGGTRAATAEPAANQTGYGVIVMFDSAGSVALGDAVFINASGKVAQANAVTGSVTNPAIGIATNAGGSDGDDVYVLTHGVWRNDSEDFSSSVGAPVYLGETVGAITKTAPSTDGDYVQRLGISISEHCMLVMPSIDVIEHA